MPYAPWEIEHMNAAPVCQQNEVRYTNETLEEFNERNKLQLLAGYCRGMNFSVGAYLQNFRDRLGEATQRYATRLSGYDVTALFKRFFDFYDTMAPIARQQEADQRALIAFCQVNKPRTPENVQELTRLTYAVFNAWEMNFPLIRQANVDLDAKESDLTTPSSPVPPGLPQTQHSGPPPTLPPTESAPPVTTPPNPGPDGSLEAWLDWMGAYGEIGSEVLVAGKRIKVESRGHAIVIGNAPRGESAPPPSAPAPGSPPAPTGPVTMGPSSSGQAGGLGPVAVVIGVVAVLVVLYFLLKG